VILGLIVLVGVVLRLIEFTQSVTGDEVSTLWIVRNNGLFDTIRKVSGDAEITPPLNFILSWFSVRLGSAPELVRLPAMISGIASIPLLFLLGRKTVGDRAGLIGAAVLALSPFMVYFSANGRAYTLMILMLIGSTLAMLRADETGRVRWWVAYAGLSCLAMYSHYTALFILIAQLLWLLMAKPASRLPALIASAAAAAFFLPWISGLRSDLDSPTTKVLEALQGDGFAAKRMAAEAWAFGHPFIEPGKLPGKAAILIILAGLVVATALTVRVLWQGRGAERPDREWKIPIPSGLVLVAMIALATPVCELLLGLVGTDLFGARNLAPSWYGLALLIGAVLAIPRGMVATACTVIVLGGYSYAAYDLTRPESRAVDFKGPAKVIDDEAAPGDVVVDAMAALSTPVTLTPLDIHTEKQLSVYALNQPISEPPFLATTVQVPPPHLAFEEAFEKAEGHRVFMLVPDILSVEDAEESGRRLRKATIDGRRFLLPENATIVAEDHYESYVPTTLLTIDVE